LKDVFSILTNIAPKNMLESSGDIWKYKATPVFMSIAPSMKVNTIDYYIWQSMLVNSIFNVS